jgi:hypothetical protein
MGCRRQCVPPYVLTKPGLNSLMPLLGDIIVPYRQAMGPTVHAPNPANWSCTRYADTGSYGAFRFLNFRSRSLGGKIAFS